MASIDDEIDALYQLPPGAFTAARNALAKRSGHRAPDIRALAKPQAAAWAVNQVYWQARPVFDRLARASEARRAAHVQQLHGQEAGVAAADARHRSALGAAVDAAVGRLRDAGDALSPATLVAITRTLEAVPSPDINGRLVRPLEPAGFAMLASLMTGGVPLPSRPPADVVVMGRRDTAASDGEATRPTPTKREREAARRTEEAARRAAEARRRQRDQLKSALAAALAQEQAATAALSAARQAAETASAELDRHEQAAARARVALADRRSDAEDARKAVNAATTARVQVERRLRELGE